MEWWKQIRLEVLRGETSKREILRREGIHWKTLNKILSYSEPPPNSLLNRHLQRTKKIYKISQLFFEVFDLYPTDVYFGKKRELLSMRNIIKHETLKMRRIYNLGKGG